MQDVYHVGFPKCASTLLQQKLFPLLHSEQKIIYSDILSKIKQKKHLIIFSHDFEFLKYNCDNILNIDESDSIS